MAFDLDQEILKLAAYTKQLAEPVDMEDLQRRGIIKKAGAWWRFRNFHELPESLRHRAYEFAQDSKGQKVKFGAISKFERVAKKCQKLADKIKSS
jgi:hypothetical protein